MSSRAHSVRDIMIFYLEQIYLTVTPPTGSYLYNILQTGDDWASDITHLNKSVLR